MILWSLIENAGELFHISKRESNELIYAREL